MGWFDSLRRDKNKGSMESIQIEEKPSLQENSTSAVNEQHLKAILWIVLLQY